MLKKLAAIKDRFKRARTIAGEIDTPEKKRTFNRQHFAVSATRYDLATRAMSLGRDRSWKKQLIAALPQGRMPNCLDLATGSGDLTFLLAQAYPEGRVIGLDLTTEMLQLANLESSSQQPAQSTVLNADDLLRTVIQQISPTAEKRSIRFVSDLEPVRVRGVHDHLMMLFENLISNAVNYSHPGGCVVVSAHQDNGCATISVIDEGIGIEAEKLPLVFEQYYRTKAAAAHNKESSGLGLAIVLQIVRLYGIRVCVHSAPHAGTRFDLYFEIAS